MTDQVPSKDRSRPERDRYPLDMAGDLQFHRALCLWQYDEIERLQRQVDELSIHAEKWVKRALTPAHEREAPHCSTCECWKADLGITSRTVDLTDEQRQMLTARGVEEIPAAHEARADLPKPINHDLWLHLHDEHGLTLLQSELDEILRLAQPPRAGQ